MNKISRKGFIKIAAAAAMSGVTAGALAACNGEGHGDLDGGGDTLGSAFVGAGNVLTGSTGGGRGKRAYL